MSDLSKLVTSLAVLACLALVLAAPVAFLAARQAWWNWRLRRRFRKVFDRLERRSPTKV